MRFKKRIFLALFLFFGVLAALLAVEFLESHHLRQEMIDSQNRSYFITDTSCGHIVNETGSPAHRKTCPGEMSCFEPWENGTNRCVKEGFATNYCGNHSKAIVEQSRPADIKCIFDESLTKRLLDQFSSAISSTKNLANSIR